MKSSEYLNILEDVGIQMFQVIERKVKGPELSKHEEQPRGQVLEPIVGEGESPQLGQVMERAGAHGLDPVVVQVEFQQVNEAAEVVLKNLATKY
ncbi:unnamed protein product, partial [Nesidiocoris tenuis]